MERPTLLYRYRALNQFTLDWLESGSLYFACAGELNDAFEIRSNCDFDGTPAEALRHFEAFVEYEVRRRLAPVWRMDGEPSLGRLTALGKQTEAFGDVSATRAALRALREDDLDGGRAIIREFWERKKEWARSHLGLCCFSSDGLDPQMWGLYGDSHRGVCVVVDTKERPVTDWKRFQYHPVTYSAERSRNVLFLGYEKALEHLLLTKPDQWSREREWRLVSTRGRGVQHSSNRNIARLILGLRVAENDLALRERLLEVIENFSVRSPDPWSNVEPRRRHLFVERIVEDPTRFSFSTEYVRDPREALAL